MTAAAAVQPRPAASPKALPRLREEITLHRGPRTPDGAPSWTLEDPVANRFFRIGWAEFEMLSRWHLGDAGTIATSIATQTTLEVVAGDVEALVRFLAANNLLQVSGAAAVEAFMRQTEARKKHWAAWLLKNYLFIRVPLIRPHRLLQGLRPVARVVFTCGFLLLVLAAALTGGWMVTRQWDQFLASLPYVFTLEGAVLAAAALMLAKLLHEMGHAVTADHFGCRVPTMGVAFLILWPVLYTDTSDAWKLPSRRQRLAIGAAGMAAELALAAFATLAWSVLPEGPLRSACFLLATTTWVLTLAINLNPFMRFDGYYLLSDALDIANLQDRAFALARWWLRERLFGFDDPPPERWPAGRRRFLIAYAFATWIYRFFLFLGIALLVYHLFFKLLGILLFVVEIGWFVLRPVADELSVWAKRYREARMTRRTLTTLSILALLIALAAIPWRGSVPAPAVLRAEQQAVLYTPRAGMLAAIHVRPGERLEAGAPVFRMEAPDLDHAHAQSGREVATLTWRADVRGVRRDPAQRPFAVWEELARARAQLAGHAAERERLVMTAPFAGVLVDMADPLTPGEWLAADEPIGLLIDPDTSLIEAYVTEFDFARIAPGASARFHPEDPARPSIAATVTEVDQVSATILREPSLASVHGGPIAVRENAERQLVPEVPVYRVRLRPAESTAPAQLTRGTVRIEGTRESFLMQVWRNAVGLLIRESGV